MKQKKVLVLGATGAMGQYLVPLLAEQGYQVDACALDVLEFHHPNVRMLVGNAMEWEFLAELLKNRYDGIVDFLIYSTKENALRLPLLASQTGHYLYLSTYRVYDNKEIPIRESSPLLIDTADDRLLRLSDDYSIYKARGEAILKLQKNRNWTIVRPAITYSRMRYQLVTLEAPDTVGRAFAGKTAVLPEQARNKQATMSWAGDVAQMIARLLFNGNAFASKCRFVHRGRALDNRTVERHCLARAHHEHVSNLHLFKRHLNLGFALAPRCNLRRKVEKRRNRIGRFALRACLEIFAQRDERQNHAGRFEIQVHHGHMRRVDVARSHSNANAINGRDAVHSRCRGAKRDERIHVGGAMHKAFETAAEIFEVHRNNGNEQQELRECKRNHVLVAQEARGKRPREHVAHRKIEQRNGEHERND